MTRFTGKVAVITGASSGIGEAVSKLFATECADLVITGRNAERLSAVAVKCRELGAKKVVEFIADLRKIEEIKALAQEIIKNFPTIDVLVNNAGSTAVCEFTQTNVEDLERMFQSNVRAPFLLTQILLPHLIKAKGCVVNVSSLTSKVVLPCTVAYGMTKAALDYFTEALAFECAKAGVRINSVSPGTVKTRQMADDCKLTQEQIDGVMQLMSKLQPLGPLDGIIQAEDVAKSVVFLASSDAACITGHCIRIEAGYNAFHALPMV